MLNKKSMKILTIVLVAVMILFTIGSSVFAVKVPSPTDVPMEGTGIDTTVGKVLGIIQWAGIVAAVAVAMFIGIKYITSSPEGKGEIKKTAGYYVAGIVILLSASAIVTWIQNTLGQ